MLDIIKKHLGVRKTKRELQELNDTVATQGDVRRLEREVKDAVRRKERRQEQSGSGWDTAGKIVKASYHGVYNIAKSLSNSYDKRRPRISQLPEKMSDMGIVDKRLGTSLTMYGQYRGGAPRKSGLDRYPDKVEEDDLVRLAPYRQTNLEHLKAGMFRGETLASSKFFGNEPYYCSACGETHNASSPLFMRHKRYR